MRTLPALLLSLLLAGSACAQDRERARAQWFNTDPDSSYTARLGKIREIAARFPGRLSHAGHEYRELGLMAGIFMQTKWQHESGRDELSIWYLVNATLTMAPRAYMDEYLANPALPDAQSPWVIAHPTRDHARAPVTTEETCRAWKEYFRLNDEAAADLKSSNPLRRLRGAYTQRVVVNKKLWRAHTTSIRYALWQYQGEFAGVAIPEPELAFWRGWIRIVFFSEGLSPSTTDLVLKPFLDQLMPPCSPIGGTGCSVAEQPALREAFLRWMMRGTMSQAEFVRVFGARDSALVSLAFAGARAGGPDRQLEELLDAACARIRRGR